MDQTSNEPLGRSSSVLPSHAEDAESTIKDIALEPQEQVNTDFQKGCLSALVLVPTIRNATEYGRPMKWALTGLVALAALSAPLGSNILLRKLNYYLGGLERPTIQAMAASLTLFTLKPS